METISGNPTTSKTFESSGLAELLERTGYRIRGRRADASTAPAIPALRSLSPMRLRSAIAANGLETFERFHAKSDYPSHPKPPNRNLNTPETENSESGLPRLKQLSEVNWCGTP